MTDDPILATSLSIVAAQHLNDEMNRQVTKIYDSAKATARTCST